MKKTGLLFALLLFVMTACSPAASVPPAVVTATPSAQAITMVTGPDGLSNCCTDSGYYKVEFSAGLARVYYIDFASQQRVVLCNRPECTHTDATCTGVIDRWAEIFKAGDKLYLYYPEIEAEHPDQTSCAKIESMNLDGSGREPFYSFDANEAVSYGIATDGAALYFTMQTTEAENDEIVQRYDLVSLDLTTRQLSVIKKNLLPIEAPVGGDGDCLLLKKVEETQPGVLQHSVTSLNVNTGEEKALAAWQDDRIGSAVFQTTLYQLDLQQGTLQMTTQTGTTTVHLQGAPALVDATLTLAGRWGDDLYFFVTSPDGAGGAKEYSYCIDCKTGAVLPLTLGYQLVIDGDVYPYYDSILGKVGQDMLVICGGEKVTFTATGPGGEPVEQQGYETSYALIPQDDFNQNNDANKKDIQIVDPVLY